MAEIGFEHRGMRIIGVCGLLNARLSSTIGPLATRWQLENCTASFRVVAFENSHGHSVTHALATDAVSLAASEFNLAASCMSLAACCISLAASNIASCGVLGVA